MATCLRKTGRADDAEDFLCKFEKQARAAGIDITTLNEVDAVNLTPQEAVAGDKSDSRQRRMLRQQTIGFYQARDGVRIAYATVGWGHPSSRAPTGSTIWNWIGTAPSGTASLPPPPRSALSFDMTNAATGYPIGSQGYQFRSLCARS